MKPVFYFFTIFIILPFSSVPIYGQNVPKPLNSNSLILEGIKWHDIQEYDSARFYYSQITRNDSLYDLACYEMALSYYEEKKYDDALAYIKKARHNQQSNIFGQATTLMGTIYDDAGIPDSAIMCYKSALKIMPYNSKLLYDIGLTYYKLDSLDLSEQYLIQAIKVNPLYIRAILILGQLNEKMNRKVEALLCYYMANLINHSTGIMELIEFYLAGESDVLPLVAEYIPSCPSFEIIDEYINSKIAMTAKYKPVFKSPSAFARQGDLLFKYLEYDPKTDNFYMNYFVRVFTFIREKKFVETCMYTYFSVFNAEKVQKWLKSNAAKVQKFYEAVGTEINRLSEKGFEGDLHFKGVNYIFENGKLSEFGRYSDEKNKIKEGLWHFLDNIGSVSVTLNYKNGKPDGEMRSYNSTGQLIDVMPYVNGNKTGTGKIYYDNGQLKAEGVFENNKLNGKLIRYFSTGQKQKEEYYKNDMENGLFTFYYKNGNIVDSVFYINGKENGIYCAFYPNNQINRKITMVNDMAEGEFVYYYPDGKICRQGYLVNNKYSGKWVDYHPNGAVEAISFYDDKGNITDTSSFFDANGVLTAKNIYSNKGKNIQKVFYRPDSSIYGKSEIKDDKPITIEYFDIEGNPLETTQVGNLKAYVKHRNWLGNLSAEGMLNNGNNDGRWIVYGLAGNVEMVSYYKDGVRNGTDTSFFSNGKIKTIANFEDGNHHGYATYYNRAGIITAEGYYINDVKKGYWLHYDHVGKLTQRAYYTNDEPDQWQEYYYPNGNLSYEVYFDEFIVKEIVLYDTAGFEYERHIIPDSACKIVTHFPNGKIMKEVNYIGRIPNGQEINYFANGQKENYYNKFMDKVFGTIEFFNENGESRGVIEYLDDKPYGRATVFYDDGRGELKYYNGQLYDTVKYYNSENILTELFLFKEDEKHGLASYYNTKGELAYQLLFYEGVAIEAISPKNNQRIKIENNKKITTYYANGIKSAELHFLNGYYDGTFTMFHSNGKLYKEYTCEAGVYNGAYREYYNNGNLKKECYYIYDEYDGTCKNYYPNGKVKEELLYVED